MTLPSRQEMLAELSGILGRQRARSAELHEEADGYFLRALELLEEAKDRHAEGTPEALKEAHELEAAAATWEYKEGFYSGLR